MNVVELASRLRSQAATQLILFKVPSQTPSDGTASVWVFGERAEGRLKQLWAGCWNAQKATRSPMDWVGRNPYGSAESTFSTRHRPSGFAWCGRGRPRLAESIRVEDWPVKPSRGPSRATDLGAAIGRRGRAWRTWEGG